MRQASTTTGDAGIHGTEMKMRTWMAVMTATILAVAGTRASAQEAARTTVPYGLLFASSWNTATGIDSRATTDGGKWPDVHGNEPNGVIEVLKGGVAGNNYMTYYVLPFNIDYNGRPMTASRWGGVWRAIEGMVESEHTYFRLYVRAHPHDGFSYANGHFVQDFHHQIPGSGREMEGSQNVYWGIQYMEGGTWRPYITSLRKSEYKDERFNKWTWVTQRDFQPDRWYRFEGHIRWLEHQRVSRAVWDMRVYDDKGEIFKTTRDWVQSGVTLDKFYQDGEYFLLEGRDPTWMMCFNGPYVSKVSEEVMSGRSRAPSHDICGFEIRNDRWCGPIAGDATPDGEAPTIQVLKPAGRTMVVNADTVTLEGGAADNDELLEVRWLSSRGVTGTARGEADWKAEIPLSSGDNVITVIATDRHLNSAQTQVTVRREGTEAGD